MKIENETIEIIKNMNITEYLEFLRLLIGLIEFNSGNNETLITARPSNAKYSKDEKVIAYQITSKFKKTGNVKYHFTKTDKENLQFHINKEIVKIEKYCNSNKKIIDLALFCIGKKNMGFSQLYSNKNEYMHECNGIKTKKPTGFILGTGIDYNLDEKFFSKCWKNIIESMKEELSKLTKITEDKIDNLAKDINNTSYIIPQLLKDKNRDKYFEIIRKNIYKDDLNIDDVLSKDNEKHGIKEIARIASSANKFRILTFNYDDYLEYIFKNIIKNNRFESVYYGNPEKDKNKKIKIIHSHGYLPKDVKENEKHRKSIVLSSVEYMTTYAKTTSYGYSQLYKQLELVNYVIGNSASDYEEQKVLRKYHRTNINSFSYIFVRKDKNNSDFIDTYKIQHFINMGLIPIFFKDFSNMADYLFKIN